MKSPRSLLVPLVLIVLASLGSVLTAVLTDSSPTLGLDLQGGFSVVLQARDIDGQAPSEESVEKAKDIIRQRIDGLGVAEPDITRQGRTVIVQLPGVTDREKAEQVVGCTAKLEFRPVLGVTPNPDAAPATSGSSTTTTADGETTTTAADGTTTTEAGATTTAAADATTTTAAGDGEEGMGAAGLAAGEGALPQQFAPTTTTTTAPPTTTTAETIPPETTTTVAAETTTTAPADGSTTTTTAGGADGNAASGCRAGTALSDEAIAAAEASTPTPDGGVVVPSKDGSLIYTLGPVGFTGDALSSAEAAISNQWAVNVSVKGSRKAEANAAFNACYQAEPTCPAQGQDDTGASRGAIAIVLDGEVLSAPTVNGQDLASGNFTISGSFDQSEAKELALVLRYGSLPVEFEQAALQQVSATLGKDSLHAGLLAGAVGIALVALYMLAYYRGLGLVVVAGLSVWGGLMYGLICWLSANQGLALTLSGIIGIVVSVGTTVDSYVVYFERLKDEVRAGRSVRSSTERGFESAIRTIITADVASFIGAFLLWWLTVGPVRGFAFFLGISVVLDLIVAYFFTRPVVALLARSERLSNSRFLGLDSSRERAGEQAGAAS
ncbi:MAG TPA: protein translocase subunit SecD [Aquihabitans sp.]|nr:protein translocase subunit SecD [Aquihabitans sp.]